MLRRKRLLLLAIQQSFKVLIQRIIFNYLSLHPLLFVRSSYAPGVLWDCHCDSREYSRDETSAWPYWWRSYSSPNQVWPLLLSPLSQVTDVIFSCRLLFMASSKLWLATPFCTSRSTSAPLPQHDGILRTSAATISKEAACPASMNPSLKGEGVEPVDNSPHHKKHHVERRKSSDASIRIESRKELLKAGLEWDENPSG